MIILVRIKSGTLKKGTKIRMMGTQASYSVEKCGFFTPKINYVDELQVGEIGFFTAGIFGRFFLNLGENLIALFT